MTLRRWATSNQRWNNVAYVKLGIYMVKQRRINVFYFKVDINNVRQHRNNAVIFIVEFYKVGQRYSNVRKYDNFSKDQNNKHKDYLKLNTLNSKFELLFHNLLRFTLQFNRSWLKNTCKNTALQKLYLNRFTL